MTCEESKEFASQIADATPHTNHTDNFKPPTTQMPFIEWTARCEDLLYFFASHKAAGTLRENKFLDKSFNFCKQLFSRDGDIIIIDNYGQQELCDSYPIKIILEKSFLKQVEKNNQTAENNSDYLSRLLERARFARVHRRFVVPVIFLPNKSCIARSSTLSTTGELLLNKATTVVSEALNYCPNTTESPMGHDLNALRAADIQLLKYFNIKFIIDLMVEDKKKIGWGRYALTVTSSEKVDREQRYRDFNISSIPYPGCEFFKRYKDNKHNAKDLIFEWDCDIHDAKLNLHWLNNGEVSDTKWVEYKSWDIIRLTQNYLRLIIDYIHCSFEDEEERGFGVLIHCISGWDRTPLFVSLLRLSLWADGVIHKSLDSAEILYLTLSYDWLLFTHQFGNRCVKGEDIFHFTFYVLQYICSEKYCIFSTRNDKDLLQNILQKVKKISEVTKYNSNKLISKLKSRSSSNLWSKYVNANHFTGGDDKSNTFSPPIQVTNINLNANILAHSWESKGCGPLSSNIRHSYIPTLLTPPSFTKKRNILPVSLSVNDNITATNPLQLVRTQPVLIMNTNTNTSSTLKNVNGQNTQSSSNTQSRNLRNFRLQSWQFVDQKNDSPLFQFISTPKSDPQTHQHAHIAPPELNLAHTLDDNDNLDDEISSNSSGDIKINHKYSLSAPSSTKKKRILNPHTPSPEMIAHPETNIIDMHDDDDDDLHCESNEIAKALVDDVIENVSHNQCEISSNYKFKSMKSAKSTPVTISDFLGLDGMGVRDSICDKNNKNNKNDECLNGVLLLKKVDSFEINVDQVLEHIEDKVVANDGRLIGKNRADRLLQVYTLFNKIYTQVMIINEPPSFYKQCVNECNVDDIDFISSEFSNPQSEAYNNITNYLKSILPVSLMSNVNNNVDEYDDD